MPNLDEHLQIAGNNISFSQSLISEQRYLDWAVTGMFYAAIHYVEAYLADKNVHSSFHSRRDSAIQQDVNLCIIYDEFSDLKNDSIQTRYYGFIFPLSEIVSRIQPSLNTIRNHISSLLP